MFDDIAQPCRYGAITIAQCRREFESLRSILSLIFAALTNSAFFLQVGWVQASGSKVHEPRRRKPLLFNHTRHAPVKWLPRPTCTPWQCSGPPTCEAVTSVSRKHDDEAEEEYHVVAGRCTRKTIAEPGVGKEVEANAPVARRVARGWEIVFGRDGQDAQRV